MAEVRLDVEGLPEEVRQSRAWTWQTACRIAGVGWGEGTGGDGSTRTIRHAEGGLPYEEVFDHVGPCPAFPDPAEYETAQPRRDLLGPADFLLMHREERAFFHEDGHHRALHFDDCADPDIYRTPWVDLLARWIAEQAAAAAQQEDILDARLLPWGRARPAIAVTSDADEIRWSWRRRALVTLTRPWRHLGGNAYWNVHELAAEIERHGMRGTFHLGFGQGHPKGLQYQATEVAGDLRELSERGHEIGIHGSYLSYRRPRQLKREREAMERIVQRPVRTIRQHYLNFDRDITWKAQAEAGLQVDSTVMVRGINGFKAGTAHPYRPYGEDILEIPLTAMDTYLLKGHNVDEALAELHTLWGHIRSTGGVMVLNWHNEWFNTRDHPAYPETLHRFLDDVLVDRPVTGTLQELARQWRRRNRVEMVLDGEGLTLHVPERYQTDLAVELLGPWDIEKGLTVLGAASFRVLTGPTGRPVVELQDVAGTVRIQPA